MARARGARIRKMRRRRNERFILSVCGGVVVVVAVVARIVDRDVIFENGEGLKETRMEG